MHNSMHSFVLSQTRLTSLEVLPRIRLHLAEEVIPVWERSEREAPPFWAFAWAGGQALACYLFDHPELVQGKHVLDLASGSGLVAIAAALCEAASVLATEIDDHAIEAVRLNAAANNVRVETHLGDVLGQTAETDVILAGDVFYSRDMTARILSYLDRARAELILAGDPGRAYAPQTGFDTVAEYDIPVSRELESSDLKRARVLRAATAA